MAVFYDIQIYIYIYAILGFSYVHWVFIDSTDSFSMLGAKSLPEIMLTYC